MTNLLKIPRNNLKDTKKIYIIVFETKIDTTNFTVKLLDKKLEKAMKITSKILAKQSIIFLDIQFLVNFLSFYSQVVGLGKVFIQNL